MGLNLVTIPDAYTLPNMMDLTRMSGCTIFGKVDLGKGQIPKHAKDILAFMDFCAWGLVCAMLSMHDGPRCLSMPFIFLYLEDIIVGSRDIQSHIQHLHLLFERLQNYGLVMNGE
jgi:hypothetical protein